MIAPRTVERKVARAFVTPRFRVSLRSVPELPPADQSVRLGTPAAGAFVAAWRWGWKPAVLLVHGWEDDHRVFAPLVLALRARGQSVVALDLPAHGRSGGRTLPMAAVLGAIAEVAATLAPVNAVLGHSLGGMAVLLAAARGLAVERAVAVAAPISTARTLARVMARIGLSEARREGIARELAVRMGAPIEAFDLEREGQGLALPGLILHGREDKHVPFQSSEALARVWSGALLQVVDGAGHRRILADARVIARVADFLAGERHEGPVPNSLARL